MSSDLDRHGTDWTNFWQMLAGVTPLLAGSVRMPRPVAMRALSALEAETAILMDAPLIEDDPCTPDMTEAERQKLGWNAMTRLASSRVDAFVLIAQHLRAAGLRPPEILAHDSTQRLRPARGLWRPARICAPD